MFSKNRFGGWPSGGGRSRLSQAAFSTKAIVVRSGPVQTTGEPGVSANFYRPTLLTWDRGYPRPCLPGDPACPRRT